MVAAALAGCSPATRWVAVAGDSTLALFTPDLAAIATQRLGPNTAAGQAVADALIASDGLSIYVALDDGRAGGVLYRVRRANGQVVERAEFPGITLTAIALPRDAATVLAATRAPAGPPALAGELRVLSASELGTIAQIPACTREVRGIAMFDAGARVYAACAQDIVTELDMKLRLRLRAVGLRDAADTHPEAGCEPRSAALSSDGTILYIACGASGVLLYLDRVTLLPLGSVDLGGGAGRLMTVPDGRHALVTLDRRNELVIVDLRSRRIATRVVTPSAPRTVAVTGDGRWAYVLVEGDPPDGPAVLKLDLHEGRFVARAAVPRGSATVAVWPGKHTPVMRWR